MRRLWLGVAILLCLCALSIGLLGLNRAKTGAIAGLLSEAQAAALRGDDRAAQELSLAAREKWEEDLGYFDAVLTHEETDIIGQTFSELLVWAECGKREEFLAALGRLLVMVPHLDEMERPYLRNIL